MFARRVAQAFAVALGFAAIHIAAVWASFASTRATPAFGYGPIVLRLAVPAGVLFAAGIVAAALPSLRFAPVLALLAASGLLVAVIGVLTGLLHISDTPGEPPPDLVHYILAAQTAFIVLTLVAVLLNHLMRRHTKSVA